MRDFVRWKLEVLIMLNAIPDPTTLPGRLAPIYQGLVDGSLRQTGGVIRHVTGPHPGSIAAHVYQSGLAETASSVDWSQAARAGQAQIGGQLNALQGLTMATTALSALNLGVSVVGFAVLAKKLNKLQDSVNALEKHIASGFASVESHLNRLESKINGLTLLATQNAEALASLKSSSRAIQRQIDWLKLAELHASVESLSEIENGRRAGRSPGEHAEQIRVVRRYLNGVIRDFDAPDAEHLTPDILRLRMLLLALAQSVAAEAYAWRLAGETRTAADLLRAEAASYADLARPPVLAFVGGASGLLGHKALLPANAADLAVPHLLLDAGCMSAQDIRAQLASQHVQTLASP
ncbi:MAG: hypothetical protein KC492_41855, partial [Myxococcales bacterium]|nr:hypothetical protein [Myxococcales bacterium]